MASAVGRNADCLCYVCALKSLIGNRVPEEGDFNSARLISGEIDDKELKWLMEDLRAVEQGRSLRCTSDDEEQERCTECERVITWCECNETFD